MPGSRQVGWRGNISVSCLGLQPFWGRIGCCLKGTNNNNDPNKLLISDRLLSRPSSPHRRADEYRPDSHHMINGWNRCIFLISRPGSSELASVCFVLTFLWTKSIAVHLHEKWRVETLKQMVGAFADSQLLESHQTKTILLLFVFRAAGACRPGPVDELTRPPLRQILLCWRAALDPLDLELDFAQR